MNGKSPTDRADRVHKGQPADGSGTAVPEQTHNLSERMASISDIVDAVAGGASSWRTLREVEPHMCGGRPRYVTGNAAVTFFVRHDGCEKVLKCYTRTNPHLQAIYGKRFLPRELHVFDMTGRQENIDCLLTQRIEGTTLDRAICTTPAHGLRALADAFDAMAVDLLRQERAHGDLKPENIMVTPDGGMQAIDWDSAFLPQLAGNPAPETGTAAYQHPGRTRELFDKHIDDYSIAMLSVLLHASAADPVTVEHYRTYREFALQPRDIARGERRELDRLTELFASRGMALQYRLARMLASPVPQLAGLGALMAFTRREDSTAGNGPAAPHDVAADPTADEKNGLWGCRAGAKWIIPPLYDRAFDPSDGVMLAGLGDYNHYLSLDGRTLKSFGRGDRVKPFRNGRACVRWADGTETTIEAADLIAAHRIGRPDIETKITT